MRCSRQVRALCAQAGRRCMSCALRSVWQQARSLGCAVCFLCATIIVDRKLFSVLRSNMCRPEPAFSHRLREKGSWNGYLSLYLLSRGKLWSMWFTSWQTVLPRHLRLVWCVPALSGRMLTAAVISVGVQKSLMMKVHSLSPHGSVCPTASHATILAFVDVTLTRLRIARKQYWSFH